MDYGGAIPWGTYIYHDGLPPRALDLSVFHLDLPCSKLGLGFQPLGQWTALSYPNA